jgi:hypothetical protein
MPAKKRSSSSAAEGGGKPKKPKTGFREKVKVKSGVVNYVFKPKENASYNYGELEVEKDWPARPVHSIKVPPSGSPAYRPGQSVVSLEII